MQMLRVPPVLMADSARLLELFYSLGYAVLQVYVDG